MSLEIISRDILSKAQEYKLKREQEFERECHRIEEESNKKLSLFKEKKLEELSTFTSNLRRRELLSARKEFKDKVLQTQKKLLSEVYEDCLKQINSITNEELISLFSSLYKKASEEIKVYKIITSNKNSSLISGKVPSSVKIETSQVKGFIFEDETGKVSVNCEFNRLLDFIFESHEEEIYKELL